MSQTPVSPPKTENIDKIKAKSVPITMSYGMDGLMYAWKQDGKMRRHSIVAVASIILAIVLTQDWNFIKQTALLGTLLVVAELINTSIEALCDVVWPAKHPMIKQVKDISASTVLLVGALMVVVTTIDLSLILIERWW